MSSARSVPIFYMQVGSVDRVAVIKAGTRAVKESRGKETSAVGSRYQKTGENKASWEDLSAFRIAGRLDYVYLLIFYKLENKTFVSILRLGGKTLCWVS
jgi:hypothetical protein